jgi:hypothetical protein
MERFMSENNSGANIQQSDNRGNDQGKEKRQKFDPAKQEQRRNNNRNNNRRRRNNGPKQGGLDNNKKTENAEGAQDNKNRNRQGRDQGNKFKRDREQNQNQGGEKRNQQFNGDRKPKQKRTREIDAEVAKNVKKVETIDDIRSDNARITKEIYLEIASLKNINLN